MFQFLKIIRKTIRRFFDKPFNILTSILAILRGTIYILYFRLFRRNVRIGFPFSVSAPVKIIGSGSVSIGRNCCVLKNVFKGLVIVTHSSDSSVTIGNRCLLGGVTIRCRKRIEVGDRTMTAISLIQDYFFVDQEKTDILMTKGGVPNSKAITIGDNVWLGADSIVLGGSKIGNDSVLSAGTWCFDSEIGEYCLVSGNPATKSLPIERLLRLKGLM